MGIQCVISTEGYLLHVGQIPFPTTKNAALINPIQCQNLKDEIVIALTSLYAEFKKKPHSRIIFWGLLLMKFLFNQ